MGFSPSGFEDESPGSTPELESRSDWSFSVQHSIVAAPEKLADSVSETPVNSREFRTTRAPVRFIADVAGTSLQGFRPHSWVSCGCCLQCVSVWIEPMSNGLPLCDRLRLDHDDFVVSHGNTTEMAPGTDVEAAWHASIEIPPELRLRSETLHGFLVNIQSKRRLSAL